MSPGAELSSYLDLQRSLANEKTSTPTILRREQLFTLQKFHLLDNLVIV